MSLCSGPTAGRISTDLKQDGVVATAAEARTNHTAFEAKNSQVLSLMAAALGRKDKYTQGHAQRVAVYASRLALSLGLSGDQVQQFTMAGMLHDVGKLALSDRIFSHQEAALSKEMWWEVRSHPLFGAALLKQIKCQRIVCDAVLYHHERIDGSGYPFGLAGEEIPLGARIVSVADCFDAITTDRPYQKRKSCEHALEVLHQMAGTYLPADLVDLFIDDIRHNGMDGNPDTSFPSARSKHCH